MRKNLVVAVVAVVTTVILATGCGQKATARKTPEATPIETTCNRADDPANKGYALVGSGQTTVGSDHVEYLSEYAVESKEPEATKPQEVPETSNTPKEAKPVAGVPQYEDPLPPAAASVDFESILKGMGATEIDTITRSKATGNTSLVVRFGNGIIADFYFDTPVSGQGIALTSFSVYAADDAFSLTGESDYGMSSWSMSYDIDNAGARDLYYVLSPSDRYFSDTDHGKEALLLPMEITDLLSKDVAPYLQVKDVSLESEPKI